MSICLNPHCKTVFCPGCTNNPAVIVGVCREDNPQEVDEAYGTGTYARLFPDPHEEFAQLVYDFEPTKDGIAERVAACAVDNFPKFAIAYANYKRED